MPKSLSDVTRRCVVSDIVERLDTHSPDESLPIDDFDAVAFDVGKESFREVVTNNAVVQILAGRHVPIVSRNWWVKQTCD
jgi:hypothetical protein